jgi:hypothetical protein
LIQNLPNQGVSTVQIKNYVEENNEYDFWEFGRIMPNRQKKVMSTLTWDPLVPGPALAMERIPLPSCFKVKFSSAKVLP